jgi:hypothetical protein
LKLNELEVLKEYHIENSKRFAVLENLHDSEDINMVWGNIKRVSKSQGLGLYELKRHNPQFYEECSKAAR